ncbi:TorD/DmsD family molecular chaperone [Caldinitratiruptor microaerophilus]|uniref:Uncharacterized protein n=1 Tax=Caldinitratiruptor microaerophilus TaxID=671077 RepID=A0AA35G9B8_9FIRM|nr:molecular chaperone TorD family protein [Caldinitratiruptor microaerophilus]BDG62000.1 hypothetical protein caldi_30900 [Caldinitratiruptor microaerophilus]
MADPQSAGAEVVRAEARGRVYAALSRAFLYPDPPLYEALVSGEFLTVLEEALAEVPEARGLWGAAAGAALRDALGRSLERLPTRAEWEGRYLRLLGQPAAPLCPPFETEYTASHLYMQTQAMADIAGFYRAFGVGLPEGGGRPDHIATELEFLYFLSVKEALALDDGHGERLAVCREAHSRFLEDHLGRWTGVLHALLRRHDEGGFYAALAGLTDAWVSLQCERAGALPRKVTRLTPLSRDGLDAGVAGAGRKGE